MINLNLIRPLIPKYKAISIFAIASMLLAMVVAPITAPQIAQAANTVFLSPIATGNPNQWSNGNQAFSSDNSYAQTNDDHDDQGYRDFGISIPGGNVVTGIEVALEAYQEGTTCQLQTRLSWNNGLDHTGYKTVVPTSSETVMILGSATDRWGHYWSLTEFSDVNFKVEIRYNDPGGGCGSNDDIFLDHLQVKVHYETAPSWPGSWTSPAQCSTDPSGDKSPSEADLVGTSGNPAIGLQEDSNYFYFRERVAGNPKSGSNWKNTSWVVLMQTTPPSYQYLLGLNGDDDLVEIWQNTPPGSPVDFSPSLFNDPAETLLWSGSATNYAVSSSAGGGQYFVDWAIPKSQLTGTGITINTTKFFATSQNSNNYNKDH